MTGSFGVPITGTLATLGPRPSPTPATPGKRIFTGPMTYIKVPVARRPAPVSQPDWDKLSEINNFIIDRVAYDHARARSAAGGVQPPDVTLSRGLGVCMDYAALFEHLARQAGYTVTSMASDTLGHAWNRVQLAGTWWIVDVTWNDGDIFTGGRPIPAAVCRDPDFRRQYFLTTLDEEAARRQAGLINETHDVPDAAPVDYERTLEAIELLDQIQSLTARHNRHVGNTAHLHRQIDGLRRRLDQLARAYPLAVSYSITMR